MSLPTCPSCGQSVLEDDAIDCPFCGAAMDGSRGARNTPQPKKNPAIGRPGARPVPQKPAAPAQAPSNSPAAATSATDKGGTDSDKGGSKPPGGSRYGSRLVVDEEDPFGIGRSGAAQVIEASLKPDRGRLQKAICPMCEQTNFVPKSALGKSVRCANPKCMVPVFTAVDPADAKAERRPVRLADEADAQRRAAEEAVPKKRTPVLLYLVGGIVLLGITGLVVTQLNRKPDNSQFVKGLDLSEIQRLAEEDAAAEAAKAEAEKAAAAAAAVNPAQELEDGIRRMIALARSDMRDKPLARRMTGDLWLRLGRAQEAATEFNQLIVVDKTRSFYRMQPQLARYWRSRAAGDAAAATESLQLSEVEVTQRNFPRTGRAATDAALALATALVVEGRAADAAGLVASRQMDRSIPANLDQAWGTAWLFAAAQCRDGGVRPPSVFDALLWSDPLHTAVAVSLSARGQWQAAADWSLLAGADRPAADSLTAVAERAAVANATEAAAIIDAAAAKLTDNGLKLRVQAAVAAIRKDAAAADACLTGLKAIPDIPGAAIPDLPVLIQKELSDRSSALIAVLAAGELLRTTILLKNPATISAAAAELRRHAASAAPPAAETRTLLAQIRSDESAVRKRIQTELRENDPGRIAAMYRTGMNRASSLSQSAEDRRSLLVITLCRASAAGGGSAVRQALNDMADLQAEVQLDELRGLIALAAMAGKDPIAEFAIPEPGAATAPPPTTLAPMLVELGRAAGAAAALEGTKPGNALQWLDQGIEPLPTLRAALAVELAERVSGSTDVTTALTAISSLRNGLWREECFEASGQVLGARGLSADIRAWSSTAKILAQEQIALGYGLGLSQVRSLSAGAPKLQ